MVTENNIPGTGTRGNEPVTFTNVTKDVGLAGVNGNFFSWTDYNNDDYPDLLVNGWRLFENSGPPDYNFTDVTSAVNLSSGPGYGTWGDYDNDGWLDFYAPAGKDKQDRLWHNDGNGNFTDMTVEAGNVTDLYPSTAAGWGDYDRDGDLDLYVTNGEIESGGNYIHYADVFYRNNGDGTFTDVTVEAGIDDYTKPFYGRGVAWGDYDNDGWLDIYISNYRIQPNYLWRNNHDGTFTNVAFELGTTGDESYYQGNGPYYGHTIGSSWGDMNNDGYLDLWVSNLVHKYVGGGDIRGYICDDSNIYKNNGAPFFNFTDDRPNSTIPYKPIGGGGVFIGDEFWFNTAIADIDNDGDLDVYIPQGGGEYYNVSYAYSYLFRNNGDGTYTDITVAAGVRTWCTYGGAWADYNRDGFVDLITSGKVPQNGGKYEVKLYKNSGNSNNWLHVKLNGTESNRHGIGARVTLVSSSGTQIRELEGGMGAHSSQNSIPVEFGLGSDISITYVQVLWPSGIKQRVNPSINQFITITEDTTGYRITSISVDKTTAVEDEVLTFNGAASGSPGHYEWDFDGDGQYDWSSTAVAGPANHAYAKSGVFNARLTVWDEVSTVAAFESTDYITVTNVDPTADAGTDLTVWEDEVISFNASGSTDTASDIPLLGYRWDFDDGTPVSDWYNTPLINYSYANSGIYDVTLTVRDDDGALSSDTIKITVKNKPPEADAGADRVVAEDEEILLQGIWNDSVSDIPYVTYKWDFGDDETTSWIRDWNASHTYTEMGVYTVTFSVRDGEDITSDTANVTVYNPVPDSHVMANRTVKEDEELMLRGWGSDNPSDSAELNYYWDFGDGSDSGWLARDANTSHTYTKAGVYNATLIVRDGDLATANATVVITVNNAIPQITLGADIKGVEDDKISLTGTGSDTVSDLSTLEYRWDFGDGSEQVNWSSSPDTTHVYTKKGSYKAVLKVRDDDLAEAEDSLYVTIRNAVPAADASADASRIDENDVVKFSAARSTDTESDLDTLNYTWDFADGELSYDVEVSHRFQNEGSYNVRLIVTDDDDDRDEDSITISVSNVRPTAAFSIEGAGEVGVELTFNANATTDTPNDLEGLNYIWDFGDGNSSMGKIVQYAYNRGGIFNVKLTVRDDNGAVHSVSQPVEIAGEPETGGTETTRETLSVVGVLAILGVATILAFVLILIFVFVLRPKKRPGADTTPVFESPAEAVAPGMIVAPADAHIMEGEIVTIPSQIYAVEGEFVTGTHSPALAEMRPPFCGQCGTQSLYNDAEGAWMCPNCNIAIPGPAGMPSEPQTVEIGTEEVPVLPPAAEGETEEISEGTEINQEDMTEYEEADEQDLGGAKEGEDETYL